MTPSMIWRLPEAQRRSAFGHALRELFLGVAATSTPCLSHQQPLHGYPREAFVGQVGFVAVGGHEGFPYGPLVRGRGGKTESCDYAVRVLPPKPP